MKLLEIQYSAIAYTHYIIDDAAASAAYAALKAAMAEWKEFGNERNSLLTVSYDGSEYNFRIGCIAALGLTDVADVEMALIKRELWNADLKRRIAASIASAKPESATPRTGEGEAG